MNNESYNFMDVPKIYTSPKSTSIIIGKYPSTHKIFDLNELTVKMSYNLENLASVLRERGYKTSAITNNSLTHPLQNMTFRDFDYLPDPIIKGDSVLPVQRILSLVPFKFWKLSTSLVLLSAILSPLDTIYQEYIMPDYFTETPYPPDLTFAESLKFILNTKPPFFIWIHLMPPHGPYLPSEKFKYKLVDKETFNNMSKVIANVEIDRHRRYPPEKQYIIDKLRLRYDEYIMYADDEFGKFINLLSTEGIYENSILIVSSDHGESFRKGYYSHNGFLLGHLYQPFIRIPLIIHTPKQRIGKEIKSNAEHVDIAPTILDLLNMKVPEWMEGESLKGAMYYNQPTKRPKYSMNLSPNTVNQPIPKGVIAVIKEDYKYIFQIDENRGELYNIENDPYETNNLVNIKGHLAEELKQLVIKKIYHDGRKGH